MNDGYDLSTLLSVLKTDSKELINTKLELLKLEAYEKTSTIGSSLIFGLIWVNVMLFACLFAFVALGFWFSDLVDSFAGGFGLVTVMYLAVAGILLLCRNSILNSLKNFFLKELDPDWKNETKWQLVNKSEKLADALDENLEYLQKNTGSLLFNSALDALIDKIPPIVTKLVLRQLKKIFLKI